MSKELIHVAQIPVIEQRLRSIKPEIERTVAEAKSLACTPDTVISVKKTRSDLHKQFEEFEEQRKAVKALILEPLTAFEDIYKECVSDLFESADADLKGKIDETELAIKSACEDGLREYFSELCAAEHVEWLTYDRAGIKVDMASAKQKTPKKLREQITSFVTGVARGVEAISSMDNAEEIMVEFRRCLDVAEAIRVVQDRHQRIETERRCAEGGGIRATRSCACTSCSFSYHCSGGREGLPMLFYCAGHQAAIEAAERVYESGGDQV